MLQAICMLLARTVRTSVACGHARRAYVLAGGLEPATSAAGRLHRQILRAQHSTQAGDAAEVQHVLLQNELHSHTPCSIAGGILQAAVPRHSAAARHPGHAMLEQHLRSQLKVTLQTPYSSPNRKNLPMNAGNGANATNSASS